MDLGKTIAHFSFPIQTVDSFRFSRGDDLGVDLGDANVVVAEQVLDDGEVVAVGEQEGGEGVAGDVGGEILVDAGEFGYGLEVYVDGCCGGADSTGGCLVVGGVDWRKVLEIAEDEVVRDVALLSLHCECSTSGENVFDVVLQGDAEQFVCLSHS